MFRRKNCNTEIGSIEKTYGIDMKARSDMTLESLLALRGFISLSQFLEAFRGNLDFHPKKRNAFLSFHIEDRGQVQGFRLMASNPKVGIEYRDLSITTPVDSVNNSYIKSVIYERIKKSEVVICLIGNSTAWRDWVDWELDTALELGKGLCGVRLKGSHGRRPPVLEENDAPVASWGDTEEIVKVIECAVARRS